MSEQRIPAAIVEKAAKAHYVARNPDWSGAAAAWDDMGGSEPSQERAELVLAARAALEAVYADIQAEALREAADELASYDHTDRQSGYLLAGRHIMARLRARADRLAGA